MSTDDGSESRRGSLFSGSHGSSSRRHFLGHKWKRYEFPDNWEFTLFTVSSNYTILSMYSMLKLKESHPDVTFIHLAIVYFIIGLPVSYMQVIIGQYSQLSAIFFKHLSPLGHGIGYALILNTLIKASISSLLAADYIMYFLGCFRSDLQWMSCPPNTEGRCWGQNTDCEKDCFGETVELSSYVYWKKVYMHDIVLKPKDLSIGTPILTRIVPLIILWLIVQYILLTGIEKFKKILRFNLYFSLVSLTILMVVTVLTPGSEIMNMFKIRPEYFIDIKSWCHAIFIALDQLGINKVNNIMYGSFLKATTRSDVIVVGNVLLNMILIIFGHVMSTNTFGIIAAAGKANSSEFKNLWNIDYVPYFTILPQGLGFMGVPQLWSLIFFLSCILLLINNLITHVDAVERSISEAHERFRPYRFYLIGTICTLVALTTVLFSSKEAYSLYIAISVVLLKQVKLFDVMVMCIIVFWIYTVQRLSDDIHFLLGSQPAKYWKICWYTIPVILLITFLYSVVWWGDPNQEKHPIFYTCTFLLLLSPIPIMAFYEMFRYVKTHSIVGVFQPEERWGPPDPEQRHLRHVFNPREEIKYRRRIEVCQHTCLMGSKILKTVMMDEDNARNLTSGTEISMQSRNDLDLEEMDVDDEEPLAKQAT